MDVPCLGQFAQTKFLSKTCWQTFFLSFMPIYIPKIKVRYQSINEMLMIKEYWNLISREPFLAITWEPNFSQTCSFSRMLKDQKRFRSTRIVDKTNGLIFLKSPFLTIFDILFFQKNPALSHITKYLLLTPY